MLHFSHSLLESDLSQSYVLLKVDLNKWIPAAHLYSVPPAMETQQLQLYKLRPLQEHLLPVNITCSVFLSNVFRVVLSKKRLKYCLKGAECFADGASSLFCVDSQWWAWEAVCLCDCGVLKGRYRMSRLPLADSSADVDLPDRVPTS